MSDVEAELARKKKSKGKEGKGRKDVVLPAVGKRVVAQSMITELHKIGLDHKAIGQLLPCISTYMDEHHGLVGFGHLGDLIGSDLDAVTAAAKAA